MIIIKMKNVSLLLTVVLKPILSVWIMEAMQVRVLVKV
jgi:hypothetical protein